MTRRPRPDVRPGPGDVLVLRALGLGDLLTGVAPLRGLRRAWPDHRLVLAAPAVLGDWLVGLGLADTVLPTEGLHPGWLPEARTWPGGHVAVNLHGRGPQSHRLLLATRPEQLLAFECAEVDHAGPPWRRDEHEVDRWCRLVRSTGAECGPDDLRVPAGSAPGTEVVLHPGAASGARRWPVARWAELARRLAAAGHPVVVTGSGQERELCRRVAGTAPGARSTAGELDLHQLTSLVASARLLACGDTGVAHLATALGTPSVVLFGPTPPRWWGPAIDTDRHTVLWHGDGPGDPHTDVLDPALGAIEVPEVWAAVTAQLREPLRRSG